MTIDRIPHMYNPENARSWRLTKAAVFVLIGAGVIVWLVVDQREAAAQQELSRSGTTVQGKVVELESLRGGQHLTLSYEYKVNGNTYNIRKRRVGDFNGLSSGGPVAVCYDPSDPRQCVTHNELSHARFGWTPYLFGGVIVLMMGLAAYQARQILQPSLESVGD
jgi:hypothetical protein